VVLHEQIATMPWFAAAHPICARALTCSARRSPDSFDFAPSAAVLARPAGRRDPGFGDRVHRGERPDQSSPTRHHRRVVGRDLRGYGIAAFLLEPSLVLWREKQDHFASLTGTFLNRKHCGGLFWRLRNLVAAVAARPASPSPAPNPTDWRVLARRC